VVHEELLEALLLDLLGVAQASKRRTVAS
jgi:hypothetical protein